MMNIRRTLLVRMLLTLLAPATLHAGMAHAADAKTTPNCRKATQGKFMVRLKTSAGDIVLELDQEKAPKTVANFLQYVNAGFYAGTIFHRVISNFMIQGGGFDPSGRQKPTNAPIENEAANGLKNDVYTVAMARTGDPHSATAQFFINVTNNDFLNFTAPNPRGFGYAVFGKVVEGMDVVDKIKAMPTGSRMGMGDWPKEDIVILAAEVC
jgi:peptidyl-prolyl cis-trans isomerase B (cyclophilin B)